jgi:hypothetical protein
VTGWTFGRGGDLSVRVYDKTHELGLRSREAKNVARARQASEKRDKEAEIWERNGWKEGQPVTRVEVQVRGTALAEMCEGRGRCEVNIPGDLDAQDYKAAAQAAMKKMCGDLEKMADEVWQYTTRRWLRLIERTDVRNTRCPTRPWWEQVRNVKFTGRQEPCKRRRIRSSARSAQAMGAVLSLAALHGHHSPWVDTRGEQWIVHDEAKLAKHYENMGIVSDVLRQSLEEVFSAAVPIVVKDLVEARGGPREALERFICRWSAKTARFQPHKCAADAPRLDPIPAREYRGSG